ncbi:hypothetical protein [Pedobacter aquatilis]|nr:hypothetical protein [Pedobacter aquatilis]
MHQQVQNIIVQSPKSQKASNEIKTFDKSMADNLRAALLFSQSQRTK